MNKRNDLSFDQNNTYFIDTERKAVINKRYANEAQGEYYFRPARNTFRPDFSDSERRRFIEDYTMSEFLMVAISNFYHNELSLLGLTPGLNYDLAKPFYEKIRKLPAYKTQAFTYVNGLEHKDFDKRVSWFRKHKRQIEKYGLQYPQLNYDHVFPGSVEEQKFVLQEEKRIKDVFLGEMGIDYSLLE